jgi:hypothetical protein
MAGLAVFAGFKREIKRVCVRAGLAHARQQGKQLVLRDRPLEEAARKSLGAQILAGHGPAPLLRIKDLGGDVARGHALRMTLSSPC